MDPTAEEIAAMEAATAAALSGNPPDAQPGDKPLGAPTPQPTAPTFTAEQLSAALAALPADQRKAALANLSSVDDLPEFAQTRIRSTDAEAANLRARWQQMASLMDPNHKAGDVAPKPEELQAQILALTTTQATNDRELAVHRLASSVGGNPVRLADSSSFMRKVGALDPSAADFTTKLTAEISAAVQADATMGAVAGPGRSGGGDRHGGSSGIPAPVGLDGAISAAYANG